MKEADLLELTRELLGEAPKEVIEHQFELVRYRLRRLRTQLGFELIGVGEHLADYGVSAQTLGQLERDATPNTIGHYVRLAAFYGTTTDYLYGVPWCGNPLRDPYSGMDLEATGLRITDPPMAIVHPNEPEIYKRLRFTRLALGLEIKDVAKDLAQYSLREQYIGRLERNEFPRSTGHIIRLAAFYGTTTDYLSAAPWCLNPFRNPALAMTTESVIISRMVDRYPRAVRETMVASLVSQAGIFSSLLEQARENVVLRVKLAEYGALLTDEDRLISDSAVAERIDELLASDLG